MNLSCRPGNNGIAQPTSNIAHWPLTVLQQKFPCGLKSIFPLDHDYKRDVCKTFRTPWSAHKVNYNSLCYELLINGGFIGLYLKTFLESRKRFKNLMSSEAKVYVPSKSLWAGPAEKHYCAYPVGHIPRKQTHKLEITWICARWAILTGSKSCHLCVWYQVSFIQMLHTDI